MAWTTPRTWVASELVSAAQLNTHLRDNLTFLLSAAWPIGSIFTAVVSTNPATLLGFGTWTAFATGRMLVGIDAGQTEFDTVEETGGAKTHAHTGPSHTHTVAGHTHTITHSHTAQSVGPGELVNGIYQSNDLFAGPNHVHNITVSASDTPNTGSAAPATDAQGTGATSTVSGLPPYITVYMWKRAS